MKNSILLFALIIISTGLFSQINDSKFETLLKACPEIGWSTYKSAPYIDLACYVQTLEEKQAVDIIRQYAKTFQYENQLIILTKMLFAPKENEILRRPLIGGAGFIGKTEYQDWSSEPIVLINDIPFLICTGYALGGQAENAIDYFDYCLKNGAWTIVKYKQKSSEQYKEALNILLKLKVWKTELSSQQKTFFVEQIR